MTADEFMYGLTVALWLGFLWLCWPMITKNGEKFKDWDGMILLAYATLSFLMLITLTIILIFIIFFGL